MKPRIEPEATTVRLGLTIGPKLLERVDLAAARAGKSRSAYLREALEVKLSVDEAPAIARIAARRG